MARPGEYHRFHISAYMGPTGTPQEQVSDHWNVRGEAKDFFRMITNGQMTWEQARADILMTDEQAAFLLRHEQCDPEMLQRIKQRRESTWKVLLSMYRQANATAAAA